jgi:hypothetical protein
VIDQAAHKKSGKNRPEREPDVLPESPAESFQGGKKEGRANEHERQGANEKKPRKIPRFFLFYPWITKNMDCLFFHETSSENSIAFRLSATVTLPVSFCGYGFGPFSVTVAITDTGFAWLTLIFNWKPVLYLPTIFEKIQGQVRSRCRRRTLFKDSLAPYPVAFPWTRD